MNRSNGSTYDRSAGQIGAQYYLSERRRMKELRAYIIQSAIFGLLGGFFFALLLAVL